MNFDSLSNKTILHISDLIEDADCDGCIDIEYNEGVLTCVTEKGTYIINKNSAVKEIWLSSPISGAHHFRYIDEHWINKDENDLYEVIADEFERITGVKIHAK